MKNKSLMYVGIAILIYCLFYFLIPVTMVSSSKFFWGFVGSGLSAVAIFLAGYKKEDEMYDIDKYKVNNSKQSVFIVFAVLMLIGGAIALYFKFCSRENAFIEANPIIAAGEVYDGKSETTSRRGSKSTSYELNVSYKDSNGVTYKTDANVSSTEWNRAGKGMPVTVVYEKNNPDICKVLLNPKDAMKYIGKNVRIFPSIKDLQTFMNSEDYNAQKKILGSYWSVSGSESFENGKEFTNSVSKDQLVVSGLGNIYINENDNDFSYNELLKEARATMKVVYDSTPTNKKKGILLENDSMQIRFQFYTSYEKTDGQGEYSIPSFEMQKIYCFAFNKKGKFMILPGDLKEEKTEREAIMDAYNIKPKEDSK